MRKRKATSPNSGKGVELGVCELPRLRRRSFGWVYTVGAVPYHPGGFTPPLLLPTYLLVGSGATFSSLTHLIPHLKAFGLPLGSGGVFSYLPIYSTNIFGSTTLGQASVPALQIRDFSPQIFYKKQD